MNHHAYHLKGHSFAPLAFLLALILPLGGLKAQIPDDPTLILWLEAGSITGVPDGSELGFWPGSSVSVPSSATISAGDLSR